MKKMKIIFFFFLFLTLCSFSLLEGGWTTPVCLESIPSKGQISTSKVAVGPNGDIVALWVKVNSEQMIISVSGFDAITNTWNPPATLVNNVCISSSFQIEIRVDQSGNAVIVWLPFEHVKSSQTLFSLCTARFIAKENSLIPLSNIVTHQTLTNFKGTPSFAFSMDPTGQSIVSFGVNPTSTTFAVQSAILPSSLSSKNWTFTDDISLKNPADTFLSIPNEDGVVSLFFNSGEGIACYQKRATSNSWIQRENVTSSGQLACNLELRRGEPIGVNRKGDLTVLWKSNGIIYASILSADLEGWQQTSPLFADSNNVLYGAVLAVGDKGDAFAINYPIKGEKDSLVSPCFLPYGFTIWSPIETSEVLGGCGYSSVGLDGSSNALFLYKNRESCFYSYFAVPIKSLPIEAKMEGDIKGIPSILNMNPGNVVVGSKGNAVVIWTDLRGVYASSYYGMDSTTSTISTNTPSVLANGCDEPEVTVTLLDFRGQPVAYHPVALTQTGGAEIYPLLETSDIKGQALFFPTNTAIETVTFKGIDLSSYQETKQSVSVSYNSPLDSTLKASRNLLIPKDPTATSPSESSVTASPTIVFIPSGTSTITVTLRDENSIPIPGHSVSLQDIQGNSTISAPSGLSGSDGVVTFTVTDPNEDESSYIATDTTTNTVLDDIPTVNFTVQTSAILSRLQVQGSSSIPADGNSFADIVAQLLDANSQPINNHSVELTASSGMSDINPPSIFTFVAGLAPFRVTDTYAETITYTATDLTAGVTIAQQVVVTFTPYPVGANSTISASPTQVRADGSATTITVVLRDVNGIVCPSTSVTITSSNIANSEPDPDTQLTNSSGVATSTATDFTPETITYGISVGNQPGFFPSVDVNFISNLNPSASTISASPSTVVGSNSSTITVTLIDNNGNVVQGDTVVLTALNGSSTITPIGGGVSNSSGQSTFQVQDLSNETVTYSAKDVTGNLTLTNTTSVTFSQAIDPSSSTVTASPLSVNANGVDTSTITVTLVQGSGSSATPVPGHTVTLTPSGGSSVITTTSAISNSNGQVFFQVKDTVAETVVYTAKDTTNNTTVTETATVIFTPTTSPTLSTIDADPLQVPADGVNSSTVTVTLKNSGGQAVSSSSVTLTGSSLNSTITPSSATTNSLGVATFTVKDSTPEAVVYTAKDTTNNVTLTHTATVTFIPTTSPTVSTIEASPSQVPADGVNSSTVTVTLKNSSGQVIPSTSVMLTGSSVNSTITPSSATTNSLGIATFTVKDATAETVTYTAKDTTNNVTLTHTANVDFIAVVDPSTSTVIANPTTVVVGGGNSSIITVTLTDHNGAPVQGHTVSLTALNGSSQISPLSGVSDSFGEVEFTVTDTSFESVTYQATDVTASTTLTHTATVTFVSNTSATNSTVTVNPTTVAVGGATGVVTVTLKNTENPSMPVVNHVVTLTSNSLNSTIGAPSGPSNSLGRVTFAVSDSTVEVVTYTAQDTTNGVSILQTAEVNFITPIDPSSSTITASVTEVPPNGSSFSTITVTLLDSSSNPVPNHGVTLTAGSGSSTITPTSGISDSSGQVQFQVKDLVTENVTYTARDTTEGVNLTTTLTIQFTPFVNTTFSTVQAVPNSLLADGVTTSTITVTLLDNSSNPVPGYNVILIPNRGSSIITPTSGISNSLGQVIFTVKDSVAENITYTAKDTTDNVLLVETATVNFISVAPSPPLHFQGTKQRDIFASQREYEHVLTWEKSVDPTVLGYKIYEGSKLVARVAAGSPLTVTLHNRNREKTYIYKLVAYSNAAEESTPLFVTLRPY